MMEHYIGVDLHKAFFQACAVTPTGRAWEGRFPADGRGVSPRLWHGARRDGGGRRSHYADVAFCRCDRGACGDAAHRRSAKTSLKAGYAAKTDRLDARRLADALRRDSVVGIYFPPPEIRELRELCRGSAHAGADADARAATAARLLLRHGIVEARRLVRPRCRRSTISCCRRGRPPRCASLRRMLAAVRAEIATIDRGRAAARPQRDPIAIRLQQIPGIGPVSRC